MQINLKYERELNLRDMFFHILYRWRRILAGMVVFAFIFSVIPFLSQMVRRIEDNTSAWENYNREKAYVENEINRYTELKTINKNYLDHSLYMKLDPLDIHYAVKRFFVQMDDSESTLKSAVMQVYGYVLEQNHSEQELIDAFGTSEMSYIRQIASVSMNVDLGQITISVMAPTDEQAIAGCDFISKKMEELKEKAEKTDSHKLVLVSEGTYNVADQNVSKNQQNSINIYNEYSSKYQEHVDWLNSLREPRASSSSNVISRAIIGALIGLVVMLLWLTLSYLLNGRLHSGWEIAKQYTLPVFGEMNQSRAWRKGKGFDKLIEKWEFRSNPRTDESVLKNIAALIQAQPEAKTITLASTLKEKETKAICEDLQSRLDGQKLILASDFLNDGNSVSKVTEADITLILEKKNRTRTNLLRQMAGMLQVSGAKVAGAIVL